jgi:2-hydroxychromene-2-carboxylate isomerase
MSTQRARFYFSFRSPYSWLAAQDIDEQAAGAHGDIAYVPFWEPDEITLNALRARGGEFLYTPMSRAKHLYILQDIKRLAAGRDRHVTWPVDVSPWWDLPHLAYLVARRNGYGEEFMRATYRARWEQGRDICSRNTIAEIAFEIGLPPAMLASAPEDASIREEGVDALFQCYREGVFGVPFFTCRREKFWGIDRVDGFIAALELHATVRERRRPDHRVPDELPLDTGGPLPVLDVDHAGGCG